jgi:hypothetical protein
MTPQLQLLGQGMILPSAHLGVCGDVPGPAVPGFQNCGAISRGECEAYNMV